MRPRAVLLAAAAAVPAAIATLAMLAFAARELSGTTPLSHGPPRNVAEAAGAGQVSEVLRFLRAGEDPSRFWPVRAEIISEYVTRPTGVEAALWGGRGLLALFDERGFIRDASTRRHLACLAKDLRNRDAMAYLSPGGAPACTEGAALASVRDRSRIR